MFHRHLPQVTCTYMPICCQGITKINLRDEDVMMILNTLEYDGLIERVAGEDEERFRQALLTIPDTSAFTSVPCGVCPVSSRRMFTPLPWHSHLISSNCTRLKRIEYTAARPACCTGSCQGITDLCSLSLKQPAISFGKWCTPSFCSSMHKH